MRSRIRKCGKCGMYTLSQTCSECAIPTLNTFPPRYSPEDRYGKYRRMYYRDSQDEKEHG
ncbi:MAG: RNA-protein complex protein Nop10 [Thermoplasmatota archaeon]